MRIMLSYLIEHPKAKDTADGIRHWWLPLSWRRYTRHQVEQVLERLVEKKWLVARGKGYQSRLYALNKESISDILVFVKGRAKTIQ